MPPRLDIVIERILALLADPGGAEAAPREVVESTLTEGCAAALALDGERLRLERRIGQVTEKLALGDARTAELRELVSRREAAEEDLASLRKHLITLRQRAARAA